MTNFITNATTITRDKAPLSDYDSCNRHGIGYKIDEKLPVNVLPDNG